MIDRRWTQQRSAVPVWQRLRHGPTPRSYRRIQARRTARGRARAFLARGILASSLLLAVVARWHGV